MTGPHENGARQFALPCMTEVKTLSFGPSAISCLIVIPIQVSYGFACPSSNPYLCRRCFGVATHHNIVQSHTYNKHFLVDGVTLVFMQRSCIFWIEHIYSSKGCVSVYKQEFSFGFGIWTHYFYLKQKLLRWLPLMLGLRLLWATQEDTRFVFICKAYSFSCCLIRWVAMLFKSPLVQPRFYIYKRIRLKYNTQVLFFRFLS